MARRGTRQLTGFRGSLGKVELCGVISLAADCSDASKTIGKKRRIVGACSIENPQCRLASAR